MQYWCIEKSDLFSKWSLMLLFDLQWLLMHTNLRSSLANHTVALQTLSQCIAKKLMLQKTYRCLKVVNKRRKKGKKAKKFTEENCKNFTGTDKCFQNKLLTELLYFIQNTVLVLFMSLYQYRWWKSKPCKINAGFSYCIEQTSESNTHLAKECHPEISPQQPLACMHNFCNFTVCSMKGVI